MTIQNAKITGTMLGFEGHGIFTCFLYLDYGGISQGFGGYFLEHQKNMVQGILRTVGVESWEELSGKFVRVESDRNKIIRLGNIVKDVWYTPETDEVSKS